MPVVAHIDDEKAILRSAEVVCRDLATAMQLCEAWIENSSTGTEGMVERTEALLEVLEHAELLPDYEVVASLMATSHDLLSSVTFLDEEVRRLRLVSNEDDADNQDLDVEEATETSADEATQSLVLTAESQEDFIQQIGALDTHQKPRLVLLDLKLDDADEESGLKALTEIQKSENLGRVPVIMLTQHYDETTINVSYSRGASSYVLKGGLNFKQNLIRVLATWLILARLPSDSPVVEN